MKIRYQWCLFAVWVASSFGAFTSFALAEQAKLEVDLAHPTMKSGDGKKESNHLRISLTGFELKSDKERLKSNVAIVIDKSGSMQGDKIEQARKAAISAIDRLSDEDIVSIVTYDDGVQVLVPATKASDREGIKSKIQSINANGSTALFAGVSKGAAEVRKFLSSNRVNRVILLSDGIANVGPSSPAELEELGGSLIKEGISVTTMGLGLGYNEDLMSRLALAGNGNHVFIEDADQMVAVFQREFDDVMSVVAKNIKFRVSLSEGIRPVKVLNYPAEINAQTVEISLGQLYARQQRYFVLELEVPSGSNDSQREVANVAVTYDNMQTSTQDKLSNAVAVRFSNSEELVEKNVSKKVMADCVLQIANEQNKLATELRDSGKIEEARQILEKNGMYLSGNAAKLGDTRLMESGEANSIQSKSLDGANWNRNRKLMKQRQYGESTNQSYGSASELRPSR